MIVAWQGFNEDEYFIPKEFLQKAGFEVKTASLEKGEAIGSNGQKVKVDLSLKQVKPLDFEAIIFVGGPRALEYLDNEDSYQLIRKAAENKKILASICISPVILAKAGVLSDKKATVWSSLSNKEPIEILDKKGAIYVDQEVVRDRNIITANGPGAALKFAQKILEAFS